MRKAYATTSLIPAMLIMAAFLGLAVLIEASDNSTVNFGANSNITAFTTCKKVTNGSATGLSVYVPTQTSAEWTSFYTNPPAGVTAGGCTCTTPTYTGVHFDTAGSGAASPQGITWNGTYFWIADFSDSRIYRYNANGTYSGFSFSTAGAGAGNISSITWNGTYFWVTDFLDDEVYRFNANGTYSGFSFDTAASGNTRPYGITWDGTYFWIMNDSTGRVYRHNANGGYSGYSFSTSAYYGIVWDGAYFWVTNPNGSLTGGTVYRYNANGTYSGFSFSTTASGNGWPNGIVWDGTYLWVVDVTDAEVYKYGCS